MITQKISGIGKTISNYIGTKRIIKEFWRLPKEATTDIFCGTNYSGQQNKLREIIHKHVANDRLPLFDIGTSSKFKYDAESVLEFKNSINKCIKNDSSVIKDIINFVKKLPADQIGGKGAQEKIPSVIDRKSARQIKILNRLIEKIKDSAGKGAKIISREGGRKGSVEFPNGDKIYANSIHVGDYINFTRPGGKKGSFIPITWNNRTARGEEEINKLNGTLRSLINKLAN